MEWNNGLEFKVKWNNTTAWRLLCTFESPCLFSKHCRNLADQQKIKSITVLLLIKLSQQYLAHMSAPASINCSASSLLSSQQAQCRGVQPLQSTMLISRSPAVLYVRYIPSPHHIFLCVLHSPSHILILMYFQILTLGQVMSMFTVMTIARCERHIISIHIHSVCLVQAGTSTLQPNLHCQLNQCSAPSVYISYKGSTALSHHPPCQQTFTAFRYNSVVLCSGCTSTTRCHWLYY